MRRILFIAFLGAFSAICVAQISLQPNPTRTDINLSEFFNKAAAKFKNNSNKTMTIVWERTVVSTERDWEFQICDKNACWLPMVTAKEFTVNPGEEFEFYVQLAHNQVMGEGIVHVLFYDKEDPAETMIGIFEFGTTTSTRDQQLLGDHIKLQPNPASGFFQINDLSQIRTVQILNVIGTVVKTYYVNSGQQQFDVSDLAPGLYMVRMTHKTSGKVKTLRLRKA